MLDAETGSSPPVNMTTDQIEAETRFFDFMMSEDKSFAISGPGGTGKTWLVAHLSNQVMKRYEEACALLNIKPEYSSVSFAATTNKAAQVLEKAINAPVGTIHSFLRLKIYTDYKTGKKTLTKRRDWQPIRSQVIFIDECSMIDSALYEEILEATQGSKIVFVGDHSQMAPVKEDVSPIYLDLKPENFATLLEPVRNAGKPGLIALCNQLRDTVATGVFHPMQEVEGEIYHLSSDEVEEGLHHYFSESDPSARVLCYTNPQVMALNNFIRTEVRNRPEHLVPGDAMVVASSYRDGRYSLSVEREVIVTDVSDVCQDSEYLDIDPNPVSYRKVEVDLDGKALPVRVAEKPEHLKNISRVLKRQKAWVRYYGIEEGYADLRDKSACTVYKSQGSTYDAVFIDLANIGTSHDPMQVARMLYVAVSRARKKVYFFGDLPAKYIGSPL